MLYAQFAKIQSRTFAMTIICKCIRMQEKRQVDCTQKRGNCERFIKRDPNWLNHLFSRVVCFRIEFSRTKLAAGTIREPTNPQSGFLHVMLRSLMSVTIVYIPNGDWSVYALRTNFSMKRSILFYDE